MENKISKNWYTFLIKGILMVVLSIFIFIYPEDTLKTGAVILGIIFFIAGIIFVIRGINMRKGDNNWNPNTVEGLAYLFLGFLLLIAPLVMMAIVPYLIGLLAAFYGILIIIDAFRMKGNRALFFISGFTIVLLASVLIFKPLLLGLTVVIWMGIMLLTAGVFNIYLSYKLRQNPGKGI